MLQGTVVFRMANLGSKSELGSPYLSVEDGKLVKIRVVGQNPFENTLLKEYEGKYVEVEGEYNDTRTFMITEIREIPTEGEAPSAETEDSLEDLKPKALPEEEPSVEEAAAAAEEPQTEAEETAASAEDTADGTTAEAPADPADPADPVE